MHGIMICEYSYPIYSNLSDDFLSFFHLRDEMMNYYNSLMGTNEDIISNYTIRVGNFNEIQKTLKMINEILQRAAKLRSEYINDH